MRSSGDLLRVAVGSPDEPNPREPRKVALAPVTRERAVGPAFPSTPIRHRCSVRSPGSGACAACQRPGSAVRQGGLPAGGACAPGRPAVPCASKARSVASLSLCPNPARSSAPRHSSSSLSDTLGHSWLPVHTYRLLGHIGAHPGDPGCSSHLGTLRHLRNVSSATSGSKRTAFGDREMARC